MHRRVLVLLLATVSFGALAGSSSYADMPNPKIALQGLLTGDKKIDAALIQAYEQGFRNGHEDGVHEMAACKNNND